MRTCIFEYENYENKMFTYCYIDYVKKVQEIFINSNWDMDTKRNSLI